MENIRAFSVTMEVVLISLKQLCIDTFYELNEVGQEYPFVFPFSPALSRSFG